MAGELNGTKVLLKKNGTTIVGQGEGTLTIGGTVIDISNKSSNGYVMLLNGELAGKQLTFAGTFVYNSDASFRTVRADALTGTQDEYSLVYPSGGETDESFTADMVPNGMSDALPMGDKVTTSITFLSSGEFVHVPAA